MDCLEVVGCSLNEFRLAFHIEWFLSFCTKKIIKHYVTVLHLYSYPAPFEKISVYVLWRVTLKCPQVEKTKVRVM